MGHRIFTGANGYYVAKVRGDGSHRQPSHNGAEIGWDLPRAERELAHAGETHLSALWTVNGYLVCDHAGSAWHPNAEARAEISAAAEPAAEAVRICQTQPLRGTWHS